MDLPSGTLTFLFTDIEGSTRLWQDHPAAMKQCHARHGELVTSMVEEHGGALVLERGEGDSTFSVFALASDALAACVDIQRALAAEPWPADTPIRVRAALHTGTADLRDGDYNSIDVNRCARLRAIAHGGQTILSQTAYDLVRDCLPEATTLRDMGVHRLKDLTRPEHVWQLCHPELRADFPPLSSLTPARTNLSIQTTSFIGREREMEEAAELLTSLSPGRLLTLTGTGGCGKTRLALQVAADLVERFADGVWLVELAALTDPALVPQRVARALGLREEPGRSPTEAVVEYLRSRTTLLVLDNCEHLAEASGRLADALLQQCAGVTLLATSRGPLGVSGETLYRVAPLEQPDPDRLPAEEKDIGGILLGYDAVRLFVERARAQRADFMLDRRNATAVAEVCHRLDGMPLAIELAAARVRALTPAQIAARLDDRFAILSGGSTTALPRQQTLRATLDWSHDLLTERERLLLRRLAVFAGGWTLEAAEHICADTDEEGATEGSTVNLPESTVLDAAQGLVDKSLVLFEPEDGEVGRYRMLETIREYAQERLERAGEQEVLARRHLDFFVVLAEEGGSQLTGPDQRRWLERLEAEHDNLRAALRRAQTDGNATEAGLRLAGALWRFWDIRGHLTEGRGWFAALLGAADAGTSGAVRAKALTGAGVLATDQADYISALAHYEESLAIWRKIGDQQRIAGTLVNLANVAYRQTEYGATKALTEESLAIYRRIGDQKGIATALGNLANVAFRQADYEAARALNEQSLAMRRKAGDRKNIAISLSCLANVAYCQADYATARDLTEESLQMFRQLGDRLGISTSLNTLASVAGDQGDYVAAQALLRESLAIKRELGDLHGIAYTLHNLGRVAHREGDHAEARALYTESLALSREHGDRRGAAESLHQLAAVARDCGDNPAASALYRESLAVRGQLGDRRGIAESLEGCASVAASIRGPGRAARLWGAAERLREEMGAPLSQIERAAHEKEVTAAREALGDDAAFEVARQEGRAMNLEQAVTYALQEQEGAR